jgi:VWFA-related protein
MKRFARVRWVVGLAALAATGVHNAFGQAEMSSHDEPATFQARVNLVMVPVVVRDRQGRFVATLGKQDFQLFDKGKPQEISRFSLEKRTGVPAGPGEGLEPGAATGALPGVSGSAPERYIGYLFDDIHLQAGDFMRVRDAAERHMNTELKPSDRAAIFTTSGQVTLEFTDDLGKLHQTLARLTPRPIARDPGQQCPDISFYMADMIVTHRDATALNAAVAETLICQQLTGTDAVKTATQFAEQMAQQVLSAHQHETRVSLSVLLDTVRNMAAMPGQRTLILVSPGFYTPVENQQDRTQLLDRAIRANVIINTLNARGLYTLGQDASMRAVDQGAELTKGQYARQSALAEEDILAELASGTGGNYFHNNNDLYAGFGRLTAEPEGYYLLGFQPQNLKLDGTFHAVRVALAAKNGEGWTVQARRGYYAPTKLEDTAELAKREIAEALFSREELHEIPTDLHTQFFKSTAGTATVAVLAHLDLKHIKFRKAADRNTDTVTVVAALFDRNGNFVKGLTKTIDFRLKDATLENRLEQGITVRTSLEVNPGLYLVRLVVRDSEGQTMAAQNGSVEIP